MSGLNFKAWNKLSLAVDAFYDHRTDILVAGGKQSQVYWVCRYRMPMTGLLTIRVLK